MLAVFFLISLIVEYSTGAILFFPKSTTATLKPTKFPLDTKVFAYPTPRWATILEDVELVINEIRNKVTTAQSRGSDDQVKWLTDLRDMYSIIRDITINEIYNLKIGHVHEATVNYLKYLKTKNKISDADNAVAEGIRTNVVNIHKLILSLKDELITEVERDSLISALQRNDKVIGKTPNAPTLLEKVSNAKLKVYAAVAIIRTKVNEFEAKTKEYYTQSEGAYTDLREICLKIDKGQAADTKGEFEKIKGKYDKINAMIEVGSQLFTEVEPIRNEINKQLKEITAAKSGLGKTISGLLKSNPAAPRR